MRENKLGRAWLVLSLVLITGCGSESGDDPGASGGLAGSVATGGASGGTAGSASGGSGGSGGSAGETLSCSDFAVAATAHEFGPGQDVGQNLFPFPVLGPPKGGGCCQGSLDVVSLGNGGTVTLEFGGTR